MLEADSKFGVATAPNANGGVWSCPEGLEGEKYGEQITWSFGFCCFVYILCVCVFGFPFSKNDNLASGHIFRFGNFQKITKHGPSDPLLITKTLQEIKEHTYGHILYRYYLCKYGDLKG